jgi:hypothetical protein
MCRGESLMTPKQIKLQAMTHQQDDTGCWIWNGQISNSGYGRLKEIQDNKRIVMVSAQTASYNAYISPVPDGYLVRQQCGNRLCINPEHLELIKP